MKRLFLLIPILLSLCVLSYATPQAKLEKVQFDLGKVPEGQIFQRTLLLENIGDANLIVAAPYVSCGCLKIISPKEKTILAPKEKLEIKFTFNSAGYNGHVKQYFYINTNDPAASSLSVPIEATVAAKPQNFIRRFQAFGLSTITVAGLIDGINPCAFTVLVFFVSFLAFTGYKKKTMVIAGSMFILAIFVSYTLIGLGLFQFFRQLVVFKLASKLIYYLTAALAIGLGAYSFWDAWIYQKTKDPNRIGLKIPDSVKNIIHKVIREKSDIRGKSEVSFVNLALATFSCGFIVSILEFVCTGQLYLPTIVYILGVPGLRLRAIFYLIYYNIMFIIPLIIVFIVALLGVTSEQFAKFGTRRISLIKFLTALLFIVLGISILYFVKR